MKAMVIFVEVSVFILKSMFWRVAQTFPKASLRSARAPERIFALFCAALQNINFRIQTVTSTKKPSTSKKHPAPFY